MAKGEIKKGILQIEPDRIKDTPDYFEDINSIDKEIEAKIHERIVEREIQKYHNKFKRENDKRKFEGEEPLPEETLKEWLDNVKQLKQQYAEELATGIVQLKASMNSVEKLEKAIERLDQRISTSQVQLQDREANSEVSLGTSKINYIDPRLSVVFCKKYGVPIEKIFTKSLREKFKWAIESVDETWRF